MTTHSPAETRALWRRLELIHVVTYFAPTALAALKQAGYKGFWMGYFAGRSAPLGPVGPEVVEALFYNFAAPVVQRALPDAWGFAPPEAALAARLEGSVAALNELEGHPGDVLERAASLADRAARTAPVPGRPLYAANAALPEPDDPLGRLWLAATMLREHRGDAHVALLVANGISGREANVLQAAAGTSTRENLTVSRHYDDEEWSSIVDGLAARGLVAPDGSPSEEGRALRDHIEDRTDALAASAYTALSQDELEWLTAAVTPLARQVAQSGHLPSVTPMGDLGSL